MTMETLLFEAADYLWAQSLHVAVLFAAVAAVCWGLRRRSAHVRYMLWLLIVAKCLGPSVVTVSLGLLPGQAEPAAAPQAAIMPMVDMPVSMQPVYAAPLPEMVATPAAEGLFARFSRVRPGAWAAVVWLAGAALFTAAVLIKAMRIHRRIRRLREPAGAAVEGELDALLESRAVRPKLWALAGTGQPFVWGVVRGSIYVPADFGRTTDGGRRREILAHELAHVRRCDALVNALQTAAQAVFWFHPLVWIANRAIRAEREKCCDEAAIAKLAASPRDYSSAIVSALVTEFKSTLPTPSLAIAGPLKNVEDRIKTIMRPGRTFHARPKLLTVLLIVLLAGLIVPTTIALTARQPAPRIGKSEVMALVEQFFENNWKDMTERDSLAWGKLAFNKDGNVSIRYKFEYATGGEGKKVAEKEFVFDSHGGFISADDVKAESPVRIQTSAGYYQGQVQIDLKLFSVDSGDAFLKERLGLEPVDTFWILDDQQRQRLENPQLLPPVKRWIAAPRVRVKDCETAKIRTQQGLVGGDAEADASEIDIEVTPHCTGQAVLLELSVSVTSFSRDDSGKPMNSVRSIATRVTVGEGKSTLVELAGAGTSKEAEVIYALVTPVFLASEGVPPAGPADKPFSVYGRITDVAGAPVAGVEVRASCGMGTLMPTGRTVTDAEGLYVLHFGPGMRMSSREGHRFNTGFQAATIHAAKDGLYEVNLCQHANLAMSDMDDPSEHTWYKNYKGVVLPNAPYNLDFVMAPAAELRGRLTDKDGKPIAGREFWLDGDALYPSSSVFANIKTDADGWFAVARVPLKKFWFSIQHENAEVITGEITFDRPGRYEVELVYEKRNGGGALRLVQQTYGPPVPMPAGIVGTWFFNNAAGDDEQMAVFADGRVVVLYSNGHRDETRIGEGTVKLDEYGGATPTIEYFADEDIVLHRFTDPNTGAIHNKFWTRIDMAPRTQLLRSLTGEKAQVAIETRLLLAGKGFVEAAGLGPKGADDRSGLPEMTLPTGTEVNLYSGPVDGLKRSDLTTRAWMLDAGQVETLIRATMRDAGSSMLTAPKVMVFANEPAEIRIAEDMGYIEGYEAAATAGGEPQAIIGTLETGVGIVVTCAPAADDAECLTDLALRHTEVAGSERRSSGGRSYEMPVIARYELTCKSVSIPAGKTLVLCGRRVPGADTTAVDDGGAYMVILIKPTIAANTGARK
ncbi:MAG: hypothetical protein IH624_18530 [Phycisphaerae bacterium]|nr:hypothetical protein [Phycisphaerae bacterium]